MRGLQINKAVHPDLFFSHSPPSPMASSALISLFLILSLLSIGAYARPGVHFHPCKTLFISYTISSFPQSEPTLEVSQISTSADQNPSGFFAAYRIISPFRHTRSSIALPFPEFHRPIRSLQLPHEAPALRSRPAFGVSSLQERAKDILVVVAGLLFGVGCGAITAASMYLAWSLFTNQYEFCASDDGEEDEAVESPKKMGYVKIAEPVHVKEGYEGN